MTQLIGKTFYNAMRMACKTATNSPDPSTQNGAVLANILGDPYIETAACNQFPDGVQYSDERWERPLKYSFIEHAERGAIFAAAKTGLLTEGLVLVCPWAACADCARAIACSGISRLVTLPRNPSQTNPRWKDSIEIADTILNEAGVVIEFFYDPVGVNLRRDGEMILL